MRAVEVSLSPSSLIIARLHPGEEQPVSGHLLKGVVSPLAEVFIVSASGTLRRLMDQSIGLPALTL